MTALVRGYVDPRTGLAFWSIGKDGKEYWYPPEYVQAWIQAADDRRRRERERERASRRERGLKPRGRRKGNCKIPQVPHLAPVDGWKRGTPHPTLPGYVFRQYSESREKWMPVDSLDKLRKFNNEWSRKNEEADPEIATRRALLEEDRKAQVAAKKVADERRKIRRHEQEFQRQALLSTSFKIGDPHPFKPGLFYRGERNRSGIPVFISRSALDRRLDLHRKLKSYEHRKNKIRDYVKRRMRDDHLFAMIQRLRRATNRGLRQLGRQKNFRTIHALGCDAPTAAAWIEHRFQPGMSWENRNLWHIDHVYPLAAATNEAELIQLCHYTNLRPMWARDNIIKGDTLDHLTCPWPRSMQDAGATN